MADWDEVFAAAREANVAIEIDGDPSRQDVDYELAKRAVDAGCLFALDSDAHSTPELAYSETAIAHARLAGVPADRVVNCWPTESCSHGWQGPAKLLRQGFGAQEAGHYVRIPSGHVQAESPSGMRT